MIQLENFIRDFHVYEDQVPVLNLTIQNSKTNTLYGNCIFVLKSGLDRTIWAAKIQDTIRNLCNNEKLEGDLKMVLNWYAYEPPLTEDDWKNGNHKNYLENFVRSLCARSLEENQKENSSNISEAQ